MAGKNDYDTGRAPADIVGQSDLEAHITFITTLVEDFMLTYRFTVHIPVNNVLVG